MFGCKVKSGCFSSDEQIRNLCVDRSDGDSHKLLEEKYVVSKTTIYGYLKEHGWVQFYALVPQLIQQ